MSVNIFEASKIAKETILKTIDPITTVQTTGDILVDFKSGEILFGNVEMYADQGHLFHYIYRNGQVQLKVL